MKKTSLASIQWIRIAGSVVALGLVVSVNVGCKSTPTVSNSGGMMSAPTIEEPKKKVYNPLTWFKKSDKAATPETGLSMNTALPEPDKAQKLDLQIAMAQAAEANGDIEKAIEIYQDALQQAPNRADLHTRLAVCHDRIGEFDESKKFYATALKLSPGNPDVFCDIGYSSYLQRNWSDSERAYKQALTINPKHIRSYNNLGMLFARTERVPEALKAFQKAGCSEPDARSNAAFAMSMEGDFEGAREQYMLAMKADPNCEAAAQGLDMTEKLIAKANGKEGSSVQATMTAQRSKPKPLTVIAAKPTDKDDPLLASMAAMAPAPVAALPTTNPKRESPFVEDAAKPASPKTAAPATTTSAPARVAPSAPAQTASVTRIPSVDVGGAAPVVQTSQQYPSTSAGGAAEKTVVHAKDEVELDFVEGSLHRDRYSSEVQN